MTEHTPTTDEVRHMFATAPLGGAHPALPVPARMREFDRWLDRVKADAWDEGEAAGWTFCAEAVSEGNPYRKGAR